MKRSYGCSAPEWEFARLHSAAGGADRGYRNMPYIGCLAVPGIVIVMYGLYYLLGALLPDLADSGVAWLKD
ncbi:hypothetical protein [Paenibacillus abyssi]|uniref:Uncharacterized protein n=1 Tax=Paenibacillus abyssi TaxID=1340531 RepID=A0A917G2M2_9BACL|nr:hypothetical protein [Paenibacillus abyssi]GGG18738.1 hypothetical protein GCM10010916_39400 [Paenibacillus abyssi]